MNRAEPIGRRGVRPGFSLAHVQCTSPTDAVATFSNRCKNYDSCTTVIATTHDNWNHAAGLYIPNTLADLDSDLPLGRGAVAIKAEDQFREKSYPPFVLYPDGTYKPLRIAAARAPDRDSDLIEAYYYVGDFDFAGLRNETWAADVDAGEIFALPNSPGGGLWKYVPGRGGAVVNVLNYYAVDAGVWRFAESTDNGRTWRQIDVRLPRGGKPLRRYSYTGDYDEKTFRRVPLPWKRLAFGGMAFASDGALLLAEKRVPAPCARAASAESDPVAGEVMVRLCHARMEGAWLDGPRLRPRRRSSANRSPWG